MEKEFIPYQQALDLKELGFDGTNCMRFYNAELSLENTFLYSGNVGAPLYQQAFRWFREKYNLEYQIIKSTNGNYSAVIHLNTQEYLNKISTLPNACVDEVVDCYSYEEAELACLNKLIEIVKNK